MLSMNGWICDSFVDAGWWNDRLKYLSETGDHSCPTISSRLKEENVINTAPMLVPASR
jgi:hypothetical protein